LRRETHAEAWRTVPDDLITRGLRRPEFLMVDSAPGLDKVIAAVWDGVPVQRCTVDKHRPKRACPRLHDEITADYNDMIYATTGADLLLLIFRTLIAMAGAGYFAVRGFIQADLQDRDRLWCERWAGFAFGVIAINSGSVLITTLQGEGIVFPRLRGRRWHPVAAVLVPG
jgi:hypothetical protein